jgi:hypothetical protein
MYANELLSDPDHKVTSAATRLIEIVVQAESMVEARRRKELAMVQTRRWNIMMLCYMRGSYIWFVMTNFLTSL